MLLRRSMDEENIPFYLWVNIFCLTLSVGLSTRVPPERYYDRLPSIKANIGIRKTRIEKKESEQPAGKVH